MKRNHEVFLNDVSESIVEIFDDCLLNIDPDEPGIRIIVSDLKERVIDSLDSTLDKVYRDFENVINDMEMENDELETRLDALGEEL